MTGGAGPRCAVGVLLVDPAGRLLLQLRDAAAPVGAGQWSLVGGGVEPGEAPADAAARELREETGLTGQQLELWFDGDLPAAAGTGTTSWHVYAGRTVARDADIVLGEGADMRFRTPGEIAGLDLTTSSRRLVPRFLASPAYERLRLPQRTQPADRRLAQAPVVAEFAASVRDIAGVVGLYAGGSLASGDYRPATSDLDLVAVVHAELDGGRRERLRHRHSALLRDDPRAAKLHCVYVPRDALQDLAAAHLTWAHGELYRRPLSGIGRAELLRGGITVLGPPPADLIPPVTTAGLQTAARRELSGYWLPVTRKPWLWQHDVYVDLGLLTLARAAACMREDRLITKSEALTRLDRFGVPPELVRQIADRREGGAVALPRVQRLRQAILARRLCARGIRRLLRS